MAGFPSRFLPSALLVALTLCAGCSREKTQQYPLEGQVISIPPERRELTLAHKDIPNFMPAMTMAYFVDDAKELDGVSAGDLITATLIIRGSQVRVARIHKTGHAPLPPEAHPVKAMDVMAPGDVVPDDPLVDQSGQPRRLSDFRGQALAVTFIYTRCPLPDFCPLMDKQLAEVQQRAKADATLRDRVHLVTVSFDPEHDTPQVLMTLARGLHADLNSWTFLTGTPQAVEHVAERFGVSVIKEQDATRTLTHNLRTVVADRQGKVTTVYSGSDWKPDQMIDALKYALKQ